MNDVSKDIGIVYEDEHIIVCDKPSGYLSEGEGEDSLPVLLSKGRGGCDVFTVHRLDRETSGLIVYAKDSRSAAVLSEEIRDKTFLKEYLAEIHGIPDSPEGELRDLLFFDRRKNKSYVVKKERRGVKEAILRYRVISSVEGISTVKVTLITGRTHQIRVQFASRGHSLVGDRRYGAPSSDEKGLLLRSCRLSFLHPITKEKMNFEI